jgi:hypothetical protein
MPEDPAVVATREFWESSYYKQYWDWNAPVDVLTAIRAHEFPNPEPGYGEQIGKWSQEVELKKLDFEYNPEMYQCPIATAHCIVKFTRQYRDEN